MTVVHVHELIEAVAAATPDRPAIVAGGVTMTYGELDAEANRLACHLIDLGVGEGAAVGVFMERSAENLVAQLAAFKAGACVVLMDPAYPAQRLAFMLADSAAAAVVTRPGPAAALPAGVKVVLSGQWAAAPARKPDRRPADNGTSHIAYTSGSTGVPKAVLLRHEPFRNTVRVLIEQCGITPDSRGTWLCSPGFGLVEVDCFPVLAAGATLHIPPAAVTGSAEELRDWLVAERITHTLQLTAMAERLWQLDWPKDGHLRSMRVAGERVRNWPPPGLPYQVLNVYGSAEANVVATCDLTATAAALGEEERAARRPPIGTPVPGVRVYVLDENLAPVPTGEVGELYISGRSLSAGYLNRPDAERDRFLANPMPGDPHPVLYRSGDQARVWPDGLIEIVGRADDEVKVRGYRVRLGEIESVLAQQPGVRQCAVVLRDDALAAYVEPRPGATIVPAELRRSLAARLPQYMLPAAYVVGPLPTTPNGKIDRAALPAPGEAADAFVAPRTETEKQVAELWATLLRLPEVGVRTEFLALGGDSVTAMRVLDGVKDLFGVELGMADLFEAGTVEELAALIEERGNDR
ncbi:non-ribosomal peptide synthetase [Thermoactinospora rubra]|uniref:non-ribosomal peptide synthetase n=1 Tax=Thermoactinospora rubra TaxID=1088767 RepID=UPI000A0F8733|nr:non-ribosomal peptide synthetase [Thermoactinospora rubra]